MEGISAANSHFLRQKRQADEFEDDNSEILPEGIAKENSDFLTVIKDMFVGIVEVVKGIANIFDCKEPEVKQESLEKKEEFNFV